MKMRSPALAVLPALLAASCSAPTSDAAPPEVRVEASPELHHPESAYVALAAVLGEIERFEASGATVRLRGATSTSGSRRADLRGDVKVKLDLDFVEEDDVVATRRYVELATSLEAQSWCVGVERTTTKVLEGGAGIYTDGLEVRVRSAEPSEAPAPPADPEYRIRSAAAADDVLVGPTTITPKVRRVAPNVEDRVFRVRPADKTTRFPRQSILGYLARLEQLGFVVTRVQLDPATKAEPGDEAVGSWTFTLEVTSRTRSD